MSSISSRANHLCRKIFKFHEGDNQKSSLGLLFDGAKKYSPLPHFILMGIRVGTWRISSPFHLPRPGITWCRGWWLLDQSEVLLSLRIAWCEGVFYVSPGTAEMVCLSNPLPVPPCAVIDPTHCSHCYKSHSPKGSALEQRDQESIDVYSCR